MPLFILLYFFIGLSAAHQSTTTPGGGKIFWKNKQIPVVLNPASESMDSAVVSRIMSESIQQWNGSSSAKINVVSSGHNEIKFSKNFAIFGSAVLGVTEITYSSNGAIQRATILLNDNYHFSDTPGFSYLGDVVTHELGHLLGLSHSEVLNSSMFYATFPGQRLVAADDQSGVRSKYDAGTGTIKGIMRGGNQIPVFGVHVQAISFKKGEIISTISKEDGVFEITGLDLDDTYYLYTSPLRKPDSLSPQLANVQNNFCPGSYVGSFFSACGKANEGQPQAIRLTATTPVLDVGIVTINCHLRARPDYDYEKLQNTTGELEILNYAEESRLQKAFVGYFLQPQDDEWMGPDRFVVDLRQFVPASSLPKTLQVKLLSQPLGTRLEYELRLRRVGTAGTGQTKRFTSDGTFVLDLELKQGLSSQTNDNLFFIELRAKSLDPINSSQQFFSLRSFPAFQRFSDSKYLPYLLMLGVEESSYTEPMLSDNAACLDAPFTYRLTRASEAANEQRVAMPDTGLLASCGNVEPPNSNGGGGSAALVMGFLLAAFCAGMWKRTKNFLS
jgi:hypothetical protein